MGNLGMRVVDSRGEGFTVSESLLPDHQVFIYPVAGSILYNTQTCRPAELKLYRNDTTNVQKKREGVNFTVGAVTVTNRGLYQPHSSPRIQKT